MRSRPATSYRQRSDLFDGDRLSLNRLPKNSAYPLVFIVTVNWNGWQDTIDCLSSLAGLDYPNSRILVVDNGSTNRSVAQIRKVCPGVEVLETGKNLGYGGGSNVGIQRALEEGADYVWLLNNDTKVGSKALGALVAAAEADERVGGVGSVIYHMDDMSRVQVWGGGYLNLMTGHSREATSLVSREKLSWLSGASLLLRVAALNEIGLLDENFFMYWEDTDLCFRLREANWELAVAHQSRIWHKGHGSSNGQELARVAWSQAGAMRFLRLHARAPGIAILLFTMRQVIKHGLGFGWKAIAAVLQGMRSKK
jgi:GT2 family glycosyltransferase